MKKKLSNIRSQASSQPWRNSDRVQGFQQLPYESKLCFAPLVESMEQSYDFDNKSIQASKQQLIETIKKYPELIAPIEDVNVLKKHKEIIQLMMTFIFPLANQDSTLGRAMAPFSFDHFFSTNGLYKLVKQEKMELFLDRSAYTNPAMFVIHAGIRILEMHYGFSVKFEVPFIFSAKTGGKTKYFKTLPNTDFVRLEVTGDAPEITEDTFNHLIKNLYDTNLWLKTLPPSVFQFHGLVHANLTDVTHEESLSRIKLKLLKKEGVLSRKNIDEMEELLRTFFDVPELILGLTAIDFPLENAVFHKYKIRYDILAEDVDLLLAPKHNNSIYHRACKYKSELIIEDLEQHEPKTQIEYKLLAKGIRSILLIPLLNANDRIIGLLEVAHHKPYGFNYFHRLNMEEITDLFKIAVERSRNEVDNQIEAIIREKYTAIHPSVEWKFIKAANNFMEKRVTNSKFEIEEIVLPKVYPLFGQADIVGSSQIRNNAIASDMLQNLRLIHIILKRANSLVIFPLIKKSIIEIEKEISSLTSPTANINETGLVHFIHNDLHPLLEQLSGMNKKIESQVQAYFEKLHPKLNLVYLQRKAYENSVTAMSNILSDYLESAQKEAQKMIPHYFEKYKTDGVEYDIYIGQSILNSGKFDQIHLKNLRLWQLINMCELTRISEEKGKTLPIPLRTSQLIFVHEHPISIRFRSDEKQFDIDGAYNVRYEIVKKRIDKSIVSGTGERLTLPGKISIVFNNDNTKEEYLEYLKYLKSDDYIEDNIEILEIDGLQGVNGLKALRVSVTPRGDEQVKNKLRIA